MTLTHPVLRAITLFLVLSPLFEEVVEEATRETVHTTLLPYRIDLGWTTIAGSVASLAVVLSVVLLHRRVVLVQQERVDQHDVAGVGGELTNLRPAAERDVVWRTLAQRHPQRHATPRRPAIRPAATAPPPHPPPRDRPDGRSRLSGASPWPLPP